MEYRTILHNGCVCAVTEHGNVKTCNAKFQLVPREWRYNADGYPVVSATGRDKDGKKIYRTIAVHILVAKAWVPNPELKPEVNHLDFNRKNPCASNLEWVTHRENVQYSTKAGRHGRLFGEANPNYGNKALSAKYQKDQSLSKAKQGRPRGQNGRAVPCRLQSLDGTLSLRFPCQRDAVDWLKEAGVISESANAEHAIRQLRSICGYKRYRIVV